MRRILITLVVFFILLAAMLTLRFGSALYQEGNPLPVLYAIMDLEISDSAYEMVSESESQNRFVSANSGADLYDVIMDFMANQGWDFHEQLGSGFVFENADETLVIETRQYSEHYILWDVPGVVLN